MRKHAICPHKKNTGVHADYDSASKHSPYKPVDLGFNPWNCRMDMPYKNYNWTHRQMSDKHLLILAENYFWRHIPNMGSTFHHIEPADN